VGEKALFFAAESAKSAWVTFAGPGDYSVCQGGAAERCAAMGCAHEQAVIERKLGTKDVCLIRWVLRVMRSRRKTRGAVRQG